MVADLGIGVRHNSKSHHTHRSDDEHGHPVCELVCTHHTIAVFICVF
jgi:hypothetical protein